ncbi:vacuolar protein sorting 26A [Striga asiatica]|uniref:Vacuolar protein sorting 26A n=1 Tax=Striga asiatica TaxID=4170 RepID=A0A5A7QCT6_STRAF|nr:vacuolar protein sorting 26A [Striga asiatica]
MRQRVDTVLSLLPLNLLHVSEHPALGKVLGESVDYEGVRVETRERDELPAITELGDFRNEVHHLLICHSGSIPVEGRGEIVGEHYVRVGRFHAARELGALGEVRARSLHPDEVRGNFVPVETFSGPGQVPIPEQIPHSEPLRNLPSLLVRDTLIPARLPRPLLLSPPPLLRPNPTHPSYLLHHALRKSLQPRRRHPPVLHRLQLRPAFPRRHRLLHHRRQRPAPVRSPQYKLVVPSVDVSLDEIGRHRVRPCHEHRLDPHHIELQPGGHEAVRVLSGGDEHFSGHVAALLGGGGLVLDVDAGGAALNEELAELDGGGGAAEAGVSVGDDGAEVVGGWAGAGAVGAGEGHSGLALLAVVVELGEEEVLDFVGNGVVWVIGEIWAGLVGGGVGGGALPAGDVDCVQSPGLDRVIRTSGRRCPEPDGSLGSAGEFPGGPPHPWRSKGGGLAGIARSSTTPAPRPPQLRIDFLPPLSVWTEKDDAGAMGRGWG